MHVVHLLASANRRGAEVFATDLARALDQRGHRDEVVALAPATGGTGLDVEELRALGSPGDLRALRRRVRAADVVVGHGSRALVAGTLATLGASTPFVYRSIGDPRFWGSSRARRLRVGLQLRRAERVTALWPAAAAAIAEQYGVDPGRIDVVPNAADHHRFTPADDAERAEARSALGVEGRRAVVAYVGALSAEKRVVRAVEAVAELDDVALVIAGDGPQRAEVAAAVARLLPGRGAVLGTLDDVRPLYRAADALVLVSATEGQPGVVIEAGLCGLAVVATDVGGVAGVVADGRTGLLVPPDAPAAAVADALRAALERRHELGAAAVDRCRHEFSLEAVTERFEAVLAAVVAPAPTATR